MNESKVISMEWSQLDGQLTPRIRVAYQLTPTINSVPSFLTRVEIIFEKPAAAHKTTH